MIFFLHSTFSNLRNNSVPQMAMLRISLFKFFSERKGYLIKNRWSRFQDFHKIAKSGKFLYDQACVV